MIRDIARRQSISESYLAKILQLLAKTDLVDSIRGKNGGFRLSKPAREITLGDIVRALDGDAGTYECGFKPKGCPMEPRSCFVPLVFEEARRRMFDVLDVVSLEDLSIQMQQIEQSQRIEGVGTS